MHKISVPIIPTKYNFSKEAELVELKRAGADIVYLSMGVVPSIGHPERQRFLKILEECIPFYRENGLTVGVWIWTFMRTTEPEKNAVNITGSKGQKVGGNFCPTGKGIIDDTCDFVREVAKLGPDMIMFDDDLRFSALGVGMGCYCENHMKMVQEKLGEEITREELCKKVYEGSNKYRKAWLESMGESIANFAIKVREAIDSVDKNIRFGACSVMSLWDIDGIDSAKVAKLLAGQTRPFLRLIGAPYWAANPAAFKMWGLRLQNVIELERMEYAWCQDMGYDDLEVYTEGDTYHRPRFVTPASYLEGFDSALKCAGVGEGTHKYLIEYTGSASYDKVYIDRHLKNADFYNKIPEIFGDKECAGIRIYEEMNKFMEADFTGIEDPEKYAEDMFYSRAARVLSDNSIPSTYQGKGMCGMAFGENARHLTDEAFENGLILDIRAARILMEKGVDVGIEKIGETVPATELYGIKQNEGCFAGDGRAYTVTLKDGAEVLVNNLYEEHTKSSIFCFKYKNANGQRFLVFTYDAHFSDEKCHRNYVVPAVIREEIEWLSGNKLPVCVIGNPDCYVVCKKNSEGMSVGIWNFNADEMAEQDIKLDGNYSSITSLRCQATLNGDTVRISEIAPFNFAAFEIKF